VGDSWFGRKEDCVKEVPLVRGWEARRTHTNLGRSVRKGKAKSVSPSWGGADRKAAFPAGKAGTYGKLAKAGSDKGGLPRGVWDTSHRHYRADQAGQMVEEGSEAVF